MLSPVGPAHRGPQHNRNDQRDPGPAGLPLSTSFFSPLPSARISDKENGRCSGGVLLTGVIEGQLMLPRDKRQEEILLTCFGFCLFCWSEGLSSECCPLPEMKSVAPFKKL